MAALLLQPSNVLVLDEPTNHLDMRSKDVLKEAVRDYKGALVVVSHDRDFLEGLTDQVLEFREGKVQVHLGDIEEYLAKREMEDMRQVEHSTATSLALNGNGQVAAAKTSNGASSTSLSPEAYKNLQREIQNAERRVDQIEKDSAKLEKKLADVAYYNKPEAKQTIAEHAKLQQQLSEAMSNWERAQGKLDLVAA